MPDNRFAPLDAAEIAAAPAAPKADEWVPILPVPPAAPRTVPPHRLGKPSDRWAYRDRANTLNGLVCRFDTPDGKQILPLTYCRNADTGETAWRWRGFGDPRPLYGLEKLDALPDAPLLVVEGEKVANAARAQFPDYVTVTSPGGSNAAAKADWTPLKGRRVIIWPDADDPGRKYANDVARLVGQAGAVSVAVVHVPASWPTGWDLADRLPEGVAADDLHSMLAAAVPVVAEALPSVDGDAWPAPDMSVVAEGRRRPPQLPVEVFGSWSGWINDTAEATSSPPDYAAVALLVVAASLVGNARWVSPWGGWAEPSCLWAGLVGDPSSGKSPAMTPLLGAMHATEADLAVGHDETRREWLTAKERAACVRAAWESDVKAATKDGTPPPLMPSDAEAPDEPARPRLVMGDATGEALAATLAGQPKGFLMVRDELAGWLAGFDRYSGGGAERAFWLEAFGGRSFTIDRVKNGGKPVVIRHLAVSVLGGIQPDRLSSLLHSGDDDGLSSRLLVTWPESRPPKRPTRTADNESATAALRRLQALEMGLDEHGGPVPVVAPLAAAAADLFDEWRRENHAATQAATGRLAGHMGKMPGIVLRLALALEHLWWSWSGDGPPPFAVSLKAIAGAAALASDYFLPMAERACGDAALPEAERLAATLGRWIVKTRPTAINARDIRRRAGLPGLRERPAVKVAIDALEDAGWLRPAPSREGPGRRKDDYSINPKL